MTAPSSAPAEEVREKSVLVPPTPGNGTSRFKRLAGMAGTRPLDPLMQDEENTQGRISGMKEEKEEGASFPGVSTRAIPGDKILPPLRKEKEEPQEPQTQAQKRKANAMGIDAAPSQVEAVEAVKKRHAVEGSIEVGHSQEPKTVGGSSKTKGEIEALKER
ncbi:hypothetical protein BU17DRAFT_80278 [Hysterangium stoloniferum]|nr:hypothetical protein BU17DRAFT_80278 [Hysterangium stoloniferum]